MAKRFARIDCSGSGRVAHSTAVSAVLLTLTSALFISPALLCAQDAALGVPSPAHVIPQGTVFLVQLLDRLDTRRAKPADHFRATLAEDLVAPDGVSIPRGKKIKGDVSAVEPGLHTRLLLSFDEIDTDRGWIPLIATVTGVPGEHGLKQLGQEGEIERKGMSKEEIAEAVVIGASEGAAEGANSGGRRGAAAGAGSGAAVNGMAAFEAGHEFVLDRGTALELRLDRNLQLRTH